jgi:hypothetical protein
MRPFGGDTQTKNARPCPASVKTFAVRGRLAKTAGAVSLLDSQVTGLVRRRLFMVTRLKTFVPWAKWTKLATLAVRPFSSRHSHEFTQARFTVSNFPSGLRSWAAGSTLRGAISSFVAGGALYWRKRDRRIDAERLSERGSLRPGQGFAGRARPPLFHANASCGSGRPPGCSGPVQGTCGTLLLKPQ